MTDAEKSVDAAYAREERMRGAAQDMFELLRWIDAECALPEEIVNKWMQIYLFIEWGKR